MICKRLERLDFQEHHGHRKRQTCKHKSKPTCLSFGANTLNGTITTAAKTNFITKTSAFFSHVSIMPRKQVKIVENSLISGERHSEVVSVGLK